jgi:hypothetical protein
MASQRKLEHSGYATAQREKVKTVALAHSRKELSVNHIYTRREFIEFELTSVARLESCGPAHAVFELQSEPASEGA